MQRNRDILHDGYDVHLKSPTHPRASSSNGIVRFMRFSTRIFGRGQRGGVADASISECSARTSWKKESLLYKRD